MNERLQETALTFSHSMTSYLRRAAKSDSKALYVVRDLSEKKRYTFSSVLFNLWATEHFGLKKSYLQFFFGRSKKNRLNFGEDLFCFCFGDYLFPAG